MPDQLSREHRRRGRPFGRALYRPRGGKAMNVLQVVEPGVDGVFRHVEGLTRFLSGRGVRVSLAYSDVRGSEGLRRLVAEVTLSGGRTLNLEVGNKPALSDLFAAL